MQSLQLTKIIAYLIKHSCASGLDIRARIQKKFIALECRNRVVVLTSTLGMVGGPTRCPGLYVGSINAAVSILLFLVLDIDGAIFSG